MKICLGGDLFLGGDLNGKNCKPKVLSYTFNHADFKILNLEQSVCDSAELAEKCTLYSNSFAINKIKDLQIDAVNIANNHIQDKGLKGIIETAHHLKAAKIGFFGAGESLNAAEKPYWINSDLALFGYCDFNKAYLKQVELANDISPGVNPLKIEKIMQDLNLLGKGKKAILFFHWGREHVWLPPYEDIVLARMLLEDERVALIVGSHAHKAQGYIEHNGKRAYMCLGNFLFPNFYIRPRTHICYPENLPDKVPVTRLYHSVGKLTYKKWKLVNRISLLLSFNTLNWSISHDIVMQKDNYPAVVEVIGIRALIIDFFIRTLSTFYKAPRFIYVPAEKFNTFLTYSILKLKKYFFHLRQQGILWFFKKTLERISKNVI